MVINREKVQSAYEAYTSSYNCSDIKYRLKKEHTYRVANLCEKIARSLHPGTEDVNLAWLLGILHDLGRFEQIRRYGTFDDMHSVNHAALSADLLFKDGLIKDYLGNISGQNPDFRLIEKAIRLHNVYMLPSGLSDRERMFCQILRDADKIDILKVNCDIPLTDIYNTPEEEFRRSAISPKVLEEALSCRNVDRNHAESTIDHLIIHICLPYGLVYKESIRLVKEQGYLEKTLSFRSDNPSTRRDMEKIRDCMHRYIEKRLQSDP
ncbi:MAG: HD domain-containing protein [Bilifractor sp.]|jgi:putative nucleotidyltransferase with HDIG domain